MKKILNMLVLVLVTTISFAQVGIGTKTPHASAILEVTAGDAAVKKGFLPPRVTNAQRNAIASPPAGLVVYNSTTKILEYSNGSNWIRLTDGGVITTINSNANTGSGLVGIGTNAPNPAAALQLEATTKGFLPPRLTITERNAITAPAEGLTIFNTTINCIEFYNAKGWVNACDGTLTGFTGQPTLCIDKKISATPCSSVAGTTLNDNTGTTIGIEYDWTGAATSGMVNTSTTRALVEINGQCWMRSNMNAIPSNFNPVPLFVNNVDNGHSALTSSVSGRGRFYQWSAAMNGSTAERSQGVCPAGWHIPSDCEWMYLEKNLGMANNELDLIGNSNRPSSTNVGSALSTLTFNATGTNSSGFTGLLTGYRTTGGVLTSNNETGELWTSSNRPSSTPDNKMYRRLYRVTFLTERNSSNVASAHIVRCIKD